MGDASLLINWYLVSQDGEKLSFWQEFWDFACVGRAFFLSEMRICDTKGMGRRYLPGLVGF